MTKSWLVGCLLLPIWCHAQDDGTRLAPLFDAQVDCKLNIPDQDRQAYTDMLAMGLNGEADDQPQYIVLVDRNPNVQAVMIFWMGPDHTLHFIGASPASTGKPGRYEHFVTPCGVFENTLYDYRAKGTRNKYGIRGYGVKGMRVYDFGWQPAERTWDNGRMGKLRLEMHATDPGWLASMLGTPISEGCIHIPATLDTFIDHYGILDGPYEQAMKEGKTFPVLRPDRDATPWSGQYLVVVDSGRTDRPDWSPAPAT